MMMKTILFSLTVAFTSLIAVHAQPREILGVTILEPDALKAGIESGAYQVLLDVRSEADFDAGHIEGATLADSLGRYGKTGQVAMPSDLAGCEYCTIAVYCRTGARASNAIEVLMANGFVGRLYNGRGTSDWEGAGYELVSTESVDPPCTSNATTTEECRLSYLASTGGDATEGGLAGDGGVTEDNEEGEKINGDGDGEMSDDMEEETSSSTRVVSMFVAAVCAAVSLLL